MDFNLRSLKLPTKLKASWADLICHDYKNTTASRQWLPNLMKNGRLGPIGRTHTYAKTNYDQKFVVVC